MDRDDWVYTGYMCLAALTIGVICGIAYVLTN